MYRRVATHHTTYKCSNGTEIHSILLQLSDCVIISNPVQDFHFVIPQKNTFQGVVITDGMLSYAVFIYKCDLLQWSGLTNHAVIGYNMNGLFLNHPLAGLSQVSNVDCVNSPATSWSTVLYPIGDLEGELQRSRVECIRRFDADSALFNMVEIINSNFQNCPCSAFQAFTDFRWRRFGQTNFQGNCYIRRFLGLPNRICCYK